MTNIVFDDIVQVMERGQITVPKPARKKLKLNKGSRLWFKLTDQDEVILEPILKKKDSLSQFLQSKKDDKVVYWTKKDDLRLAKVRKLSLKRSAKLKW